MAPALLPGLAPLAASPGSIESGLPWALQTLLEALTPNQAGALGVGLLVTLLVAGDLARVRSPRNGRALSLLLLAPFFLNVLEWEERAGSGLARQAMAWVFTAVFLLTATYAAWGLRLARRDEAADFEPNPGTPFLRGLVALLAAWNVCVAFGRAPDDCGIYTNLGAARWVETGTLPYGDPLLRGPEAPGFGAAATYGPLLYAVTVPAQALLGVERQPADLDPHDPAYRWPPHAATQLVAALFHLAGLWALYRLGRSLAGERVGLAACALYAGSPYVFGLGNDDLVIGGMAFVSHVVPTAVVLLALLAHARPALSGALLAAAAGLLFYPAFFFPAWLGFHARRPRAALLFAAGFAAVGLALVLLVTLGTRTAPGESAVALFRRCTLEHQEGTGTLEYGASHFGFWGTHPGLAGFFQRPLLGSSALLEPTFLLFAALALGAFRLARGADVARLAGLTAMLGAAVQLWKTHAGGSYVEWYYPFLLLALLARPPRGSHAGRGKEAERAPGAEPA